MLLVVARWLFVPILALAAIGVTRIASRVPGVEVPRSALVMHGAVLERNGVPFDGYVVQREHGVVLRRTPYLDGREEGVDEAWYPNGQKRFERSYVGGHREGVHRGFWEDGRVQFVRRYRNDVFDGEQLGFHRDGSRAELLHYEAGREIGQQTIWRADGRVESNYSMLNGRRYGLVGRRDCVSIHAE